MLLTNYILNDKMPINYKIDVFMLNVSTTTHRRWHRYKSTRFKLRSNGCRNTITYYLITNPVVNFVVSIFLNLTSLGLQGHAQN